eukprot:TRINITY_DN915_c0_g2_i1.p1 TRINITY_DN915_c0_g2~~TRINITY_DN915_c0_g2_i1.p1  ORF type:complete len:370 (+),score=79.32 TRINITY_DN915_c0_g2_i1:44-1153(+)
MGCTESKSKNEPKSKSTKPPAAGTPAAGSPAVEKSAHEPVGCSPKEDPDYVSLALGIPTSYHHLIVGKGGSKIKALQAASNVIISIERGSNVVVVEGLLKNVKETKQKLSALLNFDICEGTITHIELDVPSKSYGSIIGRRGSVIKQIQESTRAAIVVPSATEKGRVVISGTSSACQKAVKAINKQINSSPTSTQTSEQIVVKAPTDSYDLNDKVSRVLFFPDHVEDDKQLTIEVFLRYLGSVQKNLDICIFALTNDRIADVILNCHRRGIRIRVICDDEQAKSKGADIYKLQTAGIPVRMDQSQYHMHNKFAILDNKVLMNGSFNWTLQAVTSNNENVMISSDKDMVSQYVSYFQKTWNEFGQLPGNK